MTLETVLLLFYLGCCGIVLRALWLMHEALASAVVALLKAGARWADSTNKQRRSQQAEPDVLKRLERERA